MVANIFALCSTDPKRLIKVSDPVGPCNNAWLLRAALQAQIVILAWGNGGELNGRGTLVREMLQAKNIPAHHLGITKKGQPQHPLYVPKSRVPSLLDRDV